MDAGPYIGSVSGSMNMIGNLAGSTAPPAIGYLLSMAGHAWSLVFYLSAAFYVVGALAWLVIPHCKQVLGTDRAGRHCSGSFVAGEGF